MAAPKRVRWECPNGHPAVLGSTKPRRDSIIRYCLRCSESTGRLVERVAPSVERQRAAAAERAKTKAAAKRRTAATAAARAKAREDARYCVQGVDLRVELARFAKLPAYRGGAVQRRVPNLTVKHLRHHPRSRYGFAEVWANRIHLTIWPGLALDEARDTLLHELAHFHVGRPAEGWHGPMFKRTLRAAREQAGLPNRSWGFTC